MKTSFGFLAVAGLAAAAGAQLTATNGSELGYSLTPNQNGQFEALNGDLVDTGIAVFGPGGGALLSDFDHVIGTTQSAVSPLGINTQVSSSVSDNGDNTNTLTISWLGLGALGGLTNLIPPGSGVGGDIIDTISFELGSANFGPNGFDDALFDGVIAPDSNGDGTLEADFDLFDSTGGILFSGTFFVTESATGFGGVIFIDAGGADLTGFDIAGGEARVTYAVIPAPGAAALLGLGGLVAVRRRR